MIMANPRSFRMSLRGRLSRIEALASNHRIPMEVVTGPEDIRSALEQAVHQGVQLLVIIGGDGTLQAAVTLLAETFPDSDLPAIMMLGGGRTNYTARDIGTHKRLIDTLAVALEEPQSLQQTTRHSLIVEQDGQPRIHGFFIAGALVDYVIRDCHRHRGAGSGPLRTGHVSTTWRVLQLGLLGLLGGCRFNATRMLIDAGDLGQLDAPIRLLLITSLHHRREFIDPYCDRGEGAVRLTAVAGNARSFWLRLMRLVRGRLDRRMRPETGYLSGRTERVGITGLKQLSLDGQEHDFDPELPVTIRTGKAFRFLHP